MDAHITAVFAAAKNTPWTHTNLGYRAHVGHAGYTWTVERQASGSPLRIVGREGWGGTEHLSIDEPPATIPAFTPALASDRALDHLAALTGIRNR